MQNNPYIGPRPFERSDRDRFFGRTRETRDLLSLIMAERVVLFYAQSGAGKTSLLNTQIIPALEEEGFFVLPMVRVGSDLPPGLSGKLVKNIFVFSVWMGLTGKETPLATMTGTSLNAAINSWLVEAPSDENGESRPPILIIDQFEEILTTHHDRWQEARGFFEQLSETLNKIPKLGVVLAMREDHVAGLDPYAARLPKRLKTRYRMEQLKVDGALEAVTKPAQNAHHPFAPEVAEKLVDDLRRVRMLHSEATDTDSTVLGQYVEPVQLQVVCSRLWENLPEREDGQLVEWADVEQFGNIDRALTDFYESALHQVLAQAKTTNVTVREGQLRQWFGNKLITPEQTRGLAMRGVKDTDGIPNPVIDMLEARHVIRADIRAGARWYEIAHDRLVEPILRSNAEWEQTSQSPLHRAAQRWVGADRHSDLLYRGKVLQEALEWAEANRDACEPIDWEFLEDSQKAQAAAQREQRQHRLIRRLAVAAFVMLILAVVAGVFAWQQRGRANEQASIAEDNARLAVQREDEAKLQAENARVAEAEAKAEAERADQQAQRAKTRELLALANVFLDSQVPRSILLALEAYNLAEQTGDQELRQVADDSVRRIMVASSGIPILVHQGPVTALDWSDDGAYLLTAAEDGSVLLHDGHSGLTPTLQLLGPTGVVRAVDLSADKRWAATAGDDKIVRLWRLPAILPTAIPADITATLTLTDHSRPVRALTFSPDGRYLISGGDEGDVNVWDVTQTNIPATRINLGSQDSAIRAIAVSPKWLATIADDGTSRVWRWDNLAAEPIVLTGHTDRGLSIAIHPNERWIATGSDDATVRLYDMTAPDPDASALSLTGHEESVGQVLFSPDGHWLVTASTDTTARVWDMSENDPLKSAPLVLRGHNDQIFTIDISPDSRWLVTGSRDNTAHLWDLNAPDPTAAAANYRLHGHEGEVRVAKFSPTGNLLATGSSDNTARIWPVYESIPGIPTVLRGHTSVVRDLATTSDGRWLASGSGDGTVRLWEVDNPQVGRQPIVAGQHRSAVYPVAISADDRWLASGGQDANILLSDLRTIDPKSGKIAEPSSLPGHVSAVRALAFSPRNDWLASGGRDATVRLWDVRSNTPPTSSIPLRGHTSQIRVMDISPNGRWLVSGGDDRSPRLWDLAAIDPAAVEITRSLALVGHTGDIRAAAFSPDSHWLVTGGSDRIPRLWNMDAIDPAAHEITQSIALPGHTATIRDVVFSQKGRWLATASADDTVRLWEWPKGATVPTTTAVLRDHTDEVRTIAISADEHWLVSGSEDGTARLWNLTAPDPSAASIVLPGHAGPVWKVLINDDGTLVTTASQDAQVRLWHPKEVADIDNLKLAACLTAGRNLTVDEWQLFMTGEYRLTCEAVFPEEFVTPAEAPTGLPTAVPTPTPTVVISTPTPALTQPTQQSRPGPTPTATPKPAASLPLAVNYVIESAGRDPDDPNQWRASVLITASGGDGRYRYYHDGLPIDDPHVTIVYRACRNKPGSFWVEDGSGARATLDYFLFAPYCDKTPTP